MPPSFSILRPARFLHTSLLRVSPIRECGLDGVRLELNDRAPFYFKSFEIKDLRSGASKPSPALRLCLKQNHPPGQEPALRL